MSWKTTRAMPILGEHRSPFRSENHPMINFSIVKCPVSFLLRSFTELQFAFTDHWQLRSATTHPLVQAALFRHLSRGATNPSRSEIVYTETENNNDYETFMLV